MVLQLEKYVLNFLFYDYLDNISTYFSIWIPYTNDIVESTKYNKFVVQVLVLHQP